MANQTVLPPSPTRGRRNDAAASPPNLVWCGVVVLISASPSGEYGWFDYAFVIHSYGCDGLQVNGGVAERLIAGTS